MRAGAEREIETLRYSARSAGGLTRSWTAAPSAISKALRHVLGGHSAQPFSSPLGGRHGEYPTRWSSSHRVSPDARDVRRSNVALSRTEVAGVNSSPVSFASPDPEMDDPQIEIVRETPITGVRKKSPRARVARSFAYLSIAGLLSLIAAAAVPNAGERSAELVSNASARLTSAATVAQDWFRR